MESDVSFAGARNVQGVDDCIFYHTLDLPDLGTVMGHWDLRGRFKDYVSAVKLESRRVLDVGTASGFLTWEAERNGCGEIVSFDADSAARYQKLPFEEIQWSRNYEEWLVGANQFWSRLCNSWWYAHRAFGSKAKRFEGSVYELPAALGMFDVVMVGQILVHLRDGISALASIAARCGDTLVIAEGMTDTEEPSAFLLGRAQNPEIDYAFWHYSHGFYREILGMLGFEIRSITKSSYLCNLLQPPRSVEITTIVAGRRYLRSAG
jgi:hypothetical protein